MRWSCEVKLFIDGTMEAYKDVVRGHVTPQQERATSRGPRNVTTFSRLARTASVALSGMCPLKKLASSKIRRDSWKACIVIRCLYSPARTAPLSARPSRPSSIPKTTSSFFSQGTAISRPSLIHASAATRSLETPQRKRPRWKTPATRANAHEAKVY